MGKKNKKNKKKSNKKQKVITQQQEYTCNVCGVPSLFYNDGTCANCGGPG
jgi:rubrerythrin